MNDVNGKLMPNMGVISPRPRCRRHRHPGQHHRHPQSHNRPNRPALPHQHPRRRLARFLFAERLGRALKRDHLGIFRRLDIEP